MWKSWWSMTRYLMITIHLHTKYYKSISKDRVTAWIREFPKFNYLTLRSDVKVTWRLWRSMTKHLMIKHLPTKWHKSISKDKRVTAWIREFPKFNYLTLKSDVKVTWRSWRSMTKHLMIKHLHTKWHKSISKDKRVTAWIREFPKFNYLTLRSDVKVTWRSWRSMTTHLMIKHLHTKWHKSISKDKRVTAWTRLFEYKQN